MSLTHYETRARDGYGDGGTVALSLSRRCVSPRMGSNTDEAVPPARRKNADRVQDMPGFVEAGKSPLLRVLLSWQERGFGRVEWVS